jgi:hypothetical protein
MPARRAAAIVERKTAALLGDGRDDAGEAPGGSADSSRLSPYVVFSVKAHE